MADLPTGSEFAGYEIRGVIGRGAMGVVYRAYDARLDREIALKVVAAHLAQDPEFRARFLQEARAAARVEHAGVIPIHGAGEEGEVPYLAMRLVKGSELSAILAEGGPLSVAESLRILEPIAAGLDAAHAVGIVHRDVKPANILVPDDGSSSVLVDFGIGRVMQGTRATQTGSWVGTVDYVSPEQVRGEDVDGRSDQYSLACVLFEMLAGVPPFRRDVAVTSLYAHANEDPPDLPAGTGDAALRSALQRALAKQAGERFATCAEFLGACCHRASRAPDRPPSSVGPTGTIVSSESFGPADRTGASNGTGSPDGADHGADVGPTGTVIPAPAVPPASNARRGRRDKRVPYLLAAAMVLVVGVGATVYFLAFAPGAERSAACQSAESDVTTAVTAMEQAQAGQSVNMTAKLRDAILQAQTSLSDCGESGGGHLVGMLDAQGLIGEARRLAVNEVERVQQPATLRRVPVPRDDNGVVVPAFMARRCLTDSLGWSLEQCDLRSATFDQDLDCWVYGGLEVEGWSRSRYPPAGWNFADKWCEVSRGERTPPDYVLQSVEGRSTDRLSAFGAARLLSTAAALRRLMTPDFLTAPD